MQAIHLLQSLCLLCSAQNVKKWEGEMKTLKGNNGKLTAALKESNQHVAEWKERLQQYKEESAQLKQKVRSPTSPAGVITWYHAARRAGGKEG